MLIIAGTFSVHPDDRSAFLENSRIAVSGTRQEPGNHVYVFSADDGDPGVVRLFELWDNEECLVTHATSEHIAEFRRANETLRVTGRDLRKYEATDIGPL